MKLWQKESTKISEQIEQFTVGQDREMDLELAPFDALGSMAHCIMLQEVGLLQKADLQSIIPALQNIYGDIDAGKFSIEPGVEDVHSQIEYLLTQQLGEAGKKIHSGRSRNDQVLVDLKMYCRHQIKQLVVQVSQLFGSLQAQSQTHKDALLPGYTHLQIAMPSSFGLWFGAYAEALIDDLELFEAAYRLANKNPLGSGAGYGSSFPLHRQSTTILLGFDTLHHNVVAAQMSRGKTEHFLATAIANVAQTISRFAMDVCLYNSQNFGFIDLPTEYTTGSSIMPHKKNPDVAELLRGKCNRLKALPADIMLVMSNLPSGYHREMQILKETLFPAIHELAQCLQMCQKLVESILPKQNLLADEKYDLLFSVERVNELVMSGLPFREAYKQVGIEIENDSYTRPQALAHTHEGSLGNLQTEQIKVQFEVVLAKFDFAKADNAMQQLLDYKVN
jgi:argininosuccinate lyase